MIKIRLRRTGAKKSPSYRVVVADSRSPRDGRFIETLGYYNPLTTPKTVVIKTDRALHWLNNGAQASDTCARLLTNAGVEHKRLAEQLAALRAKGTPKTGAAPEPAAATATAPAIAEASAAPVAAAEASTVEPAAPAAEATTEPATPAEPAAPAEATTEPATPAEASPAEAEAGA